MVRELLDRAGGFVWPLEGMLYRWIDMLIKNQCSSALQVKQHQMKMHRLYMKKAVRAPSPLNILKYILFNPYILSLTTTWTQKPLTPPLDMYFQLCITSPVNLPSLKYYHKHFPSAFSGKTHFARRSEHSFAWTPLQIGSWFKQNTRCIIYCKRIILSVYEIWRTLDFLLFEVGLISRLIYFTYSYLYKCTFSDVFDLAEGYNLQRR